MFPWMDLALLHAVHDERLSVKLRCDSRERQPPWHYLGMCSCSRPPVSGLAQTSCLSLFRCSRVRVRRAVVPKNVQPARTKCSWTTTLTGKLSSFGLDPRRSSNFSFCFEHSDSVWLRGPRPWPGMPRSCWCHKLLLNPSNSFFFEVDAPSWVKRHERNRLFRPQGSLSKRLQTRL